MKTQAPDWMVAALGETKMFEGEEWVRASKVVDVLDRAQENIVHRHGTIEHFKQQVDHYYKLSSAAIVDKLAANLKADWEKVFNANEAVHDLNEIKAALVQINWSKEWEEETTLRKVLHLIYEKQHYSKRAGAQAEMIQSQQSRIAQLERTPPNPDQCFHCLGKGGFPKPGGGSLQCPECFGLCILLPKPIKEVINLLQARIAASGLNYEMVNKTFVIEHNPNCPKNYLVRLPHHGEIDKKPKSETQDNFGYGNTPNEAYADAMKMFNARK